MEPEICYCNSSRSSTMRSDDDITLLNRGSARREDNKESEEKATRGSNRDFLPSLHPAMEPDPCNNNNNSSSTQYRVINGDDDITFKSDSARRKDYKEDEELGTRGFCRDDNHQSSSSEKKDGYECSNNFGHSSRNLSGILNDEDIMKAMDNVDCPVDMMDALDDDVRKEMEKFNLELEIERALMEKVRLELEIKRTTAKGSKADPLLPSANCIGKGKNGPASCNMDGDMTDNNDSKTKKLGDDTTPKSAAVNKVIATDRDILLGRGYLQTIHPGNTRFRRIVDDIKPLYRAQRGNKSGKSAVLKKLMEIIEGYGGRFLEPFKEGNGSKNYIFVEVDPMRAIKKCNQRLWELHSKEKRRRRRARKREMEEGKK